VLYRRQLRGASRGRASVVPRLRRVRVIFAECKPNRGRRAARRGHDTEAAEGASPARCASEVAALGAPLSRRARAANGSSRPRPAPEPRAAEPRAPTDLNARGWPTRKRSSGMRPCASKATPFARLAARAGTNVVVRLALRMADLAPRVSTTRCHGTGRSAGSAASA
jgi:hypothetical protein